MNASDIKRVLITGIAGSGGSYLAEYVASNHSKVEIHGAGRWHSTTSLSNLKNIQNRINLHECDLLDFSSVIQTLEKSKPDIVFHLAAHANVRASFRTPLSVLENNVIGTANLLEAIKLTNRKPIFQMCSTSEVYGQVLANEVPIKETAPLRPSSPYAVSKVTQDLLSHTYYLAYQIPVIRTRMFAYLNPRRGDLFATSFAMQVARIEAGLQKTLKHGNLDSTRTMVDVRDAMRAYWDAAIYCTPGEAYNIGGNKIITVGEFLELLKFHANVEIPSEQDESLLRPSDVTLQIPSTDKFISATNWQPKYSFDDSVSFLLDYCRKAVSKEIVQS